MNLTYIPLLAEMRRLQEMPRDGTRFRAYLRTVLNDRGDDTEIPALLLANPMAKEHVTRLLDALLAEDIDGHGAAWTHEAAADFADLPGDHCLSFVVIDDLAGGWTNRAATDHGLRVGSTPDNKRFWIVVPLWSSEPASAGAAKIALRTAIARTAWQTRRGRAGTLGEILAQEGAALAWAGATGPSLDSQDLEYSRTVLEPLMSARDMPTQIAALFGDAAAATLGLPPLGLSRNAGLAVALAGGHVFNVPVDAR